MSGADRSTWRFAAIWLGELVSVVGSGLTGFVLGVWVYQETGSATRFALIMVANVLPGIVLAPLAGLAADRWDLRRVLILSDAGAAAATVAVAVLLGLDRLEVWHVYLTTAVNASATAFHLTAFQALTPRLVPRRHLGRANGLAQVTMAAHIAAPLFAGVLLAAVGLLGVVMIDLATAAVAIGVLLAARLPAAATRPGGDPGSPAPAGGAGEGWRHLTHRPGLLWLVGVFGLFNLLFGLAGVLVQPLILSFASPTTLGVLMFAGGSGLFAGSLVMGAWGGPRRRTTGVLGGILLGGVFLALHSLRPSAWLIGVLAPLFLFTLPVVNGCCLTLLQVKSAPDVLGRVLGTARMVSQAAMLLGYLVAGPLADLVFEPLLGPGGALAGSAGRLIGVGPGRGIALVFLTAGVLLVLLAAAGYAQPRLRRLEDELPDVQPDRHPDGGPADGSARQPGTTAEAPAT